MFPLPKYLVVIASMGHAVILSLAVSGIVKIVSGLMAMPVSQETAGNVFLISCLITVPPAGYFQVARLMLPTDRAGTGLSE